MLAVCTNYTILCISYKNYCTISDYCKYINIFNKLYARNYWSFTHFNTFCLSLDLNKPENSGCINTKTWKYLKVMALL